MLPIIANLTLVSVVGPWLIIENHVGMGGVKVGEDYVNPILI
jgi:hypothetical protein